MDARMKNGFEQSTEMFTQSIEVLEKAIAKDPDNREEYETAIAKARREADYGQAVLKALAALDDKSDKKSKPVKKKAATKPKVKEPKAPDPAPTEPTVEDSVEDLFGF